jgi:hypothetical protein
VSPLIKFARAGVGSITPIHVYVKNAVLSRPEQRKTFIYQTYTEYIPET